MAVLRPRWWESLEQWSSLSFLFAGTLALGHAMLSGYQAVLGEMVPFGFYNAFRILVLLSSVVGLLGVYPRLREGAPRLSLAAVGVTALSGIFLAVFLLPVDGIAGLLAFVSLAVGFLLFGVAGLRTDAASRPIAILLLVPCVMWSVELVSLQIQSPAGEPYFWGFIAFTPVSLALLGVGYLLRPVPADRAAARVETNPE